MENHWKYKLIFKKDGKNVEFALSSPEKKLLKLEMKESKPEYKDQTFICEKQIEINSPKLTLYPKIKNFIEFINGETQNYFNFNEMAKIKSVEDFLSEWEKEYIDFLKDLLEELIFSLKEYFAKEDFEYLLNEIRKINTFPGFKNLKEEIISRSKENKNTKTRK